MLSSKRKFVQPAGILSKDQLLFLKRDVSVVYPGKMRPWIDPVYVTTKQDAIGSRLVHHPFDKSKRIAVARCVHVDIWILPGQFGGSEVPLITATGVSQDQVDRGKTLYIVHEVIGGGELLDGIVAGDCP